ncbi:hypothetical protein B0A55_02537 [Friedmanniomyces simplex]|uniref:Myb-like domain-containing protein n=1 Tax=Friedmanniomyces simplex TaxID=329884 RepID=A0A4U0XWI5_9PEZI|nr:hypothetical protein B0A55_02537 [Friedmanniomyces simplex]
MAARRSAKRAAPKKAPAPTKAPATKKAPAPKKVTEVTEVTEFTEFTEPPVEEEPKKKKKKKKNSRWTEAELEYLHEARKTDTPYLKIAAHFGGVHSDLACRLRVCGDKKKYFAAQAALRRQNTEAMLRLPSIVNGQFDAVFGSAAPSLSATSFTFRSAPAPAMVPHTYYQPPPAARKPNAAPRMLLPKPEVHVAAQPQGLDISRLNSLAFAATEAERAVVSGASILAGMSGMSIGGERALAPVRPFGGVQRGSLVHILN